MGWSMGYSSNWHRDVGYGVPAICEHPECKTRIDRGLAYVCGGMHDGGEEGCGLYFCEAHLYSGKKAIVCIRCLKHKDCFNPKGELSSWLRWKLKDESWEGWRQQNPDEVAEYQKILERRRVRRQQRKVIA